MTDPSESATADRVRTLRHDLANPLSAVLAEAQLLLMNEQLDDEIAQSLREIERLARRMRDILQHS